MIVTPDPRPTFEVNVNAVLTLPTATATVLPTANPTTAPTIPVTINDCDGPQDGGQPCLMPFLTPAPTALPDCPANPGQWCAWPIVGTTGRQETR